jgi:hypothetical protein
MNQGKNASKARLMAGTIAIALLLAVGWCYVRLAGARASAAAAARDLADCRAQVARMDSLRRLPTVAGTAELGASDLSRQIEQAARVAEFPDDSVERIEPEPARRVGETNYSEVATQVRLRRVTLRQVFTFLHALCADAPAAASSSATSAARPPSGLRLRSIRLAAPRGEETADRWTVESTLTYMVYSPRARSGSSGGGPVERAAAY